MTSFALAHPVRSAFLQIGAFWARIKTFVLATLVIVLALAAIASFALWPRDAARNRTIAALTHNHDVAVAQDAAPKLLFARAYFLITHGRLDEAQALVSLFDLRGSDKARADLHYDLGNGRLLAAFDKIDLADFDAAGALVGLAQEDYIEAMRLNPDDWDARYNFDVAARLVRQYPSFVNTPDPRRQGPRPIWTELPNVPRGEP
ncbi:MxaK protein [Methylovirgula ligni]|uniref:MxaK protein n=1 Tax=Methylovirgula ligni TaxID=569860 RepID=A0A3D9YUJ7_9HYPH|nr:MxaK protein [Methylovirgula ligni]QAY96432.1 MxaK protein [Methylovirgula ligni]REF85838.1 mxaK protein [Methylovirgula ligni]